MPKYGHTYFCSNSVIFDEIINTSSGSLQLQVKQFKTDFVACVRNFEFLGILGLKIQGV